MIGVLEFLKAYSGFGFGGVVLVVVWMILTGRLVPRGHVEQLLAIWQKSYELSEESRKQQGELIKDAVEAVNTAADVVRALRQPPARGGRS